MIETATRSATGATVATVAAAASAGLETHVATRAATRATVGGPSRTIASDPDRVAAVAGRAVPGGKVLIADILRAAGAATGLRVAVLRSDRRARAIARPRQAAMWIAYHLTTRTLVEIGRSFGGRDHSTIWHGVRGVEDRLAKEPEGETASLIADIVRHLVLGSEAWPAPTAVMIVVPPPAAAPSRPAQAASPPCLPPTYEDGWARRGVGSRAWFDRNDQIFRDGFLAAHPEIFQEVRHGR
jgi:hypothetical protein